MPKVTFVWQIINESYTLLIINRLLSYVICIGIINDNGARAFSVMASKNYNINLCRSECQVKYRLNISVLLNYRCFLFRRRRLLFIGHLAQELYFKILLFVLYYGYLMFRIYLWAAWTYKCILTYKSHSCLQNIML